LQRGLTENSKEVLALGEELDMYLGVLGIESKNFKTLQAKLRNYQHLQSFTQISIPCYVYHPCESTVIRMVNTLFQVILRVILYYCPHFAVKYQAKGHRTTDDRVRISISIHQIPNCCTSIMN
jgi:hypothetical protein